MMSLLWRNQGAQKKGLGNATPTPNQRLSKPVAVNLRLLHNSQDLSSNPVAS